MGRTCDWGQIGNVAGMLSLVAAAGCGGDGANGPSGVDPSKVAGQVTDAEAKQLCLWAERQLNGFEPTKEQLCTSFGVPFSRTEAECNESVKGCLAQPAESVMDEPDPESCDDASAAHIGGANCTATVGEVEACIRALATAEKEFIQGASCKDVGEPMTQTTPSGCKKIETTCPRVATGVDAT